MQPHNKWNGDNILCGLSETTAVVVGKVWRCAVCTYSTEVRGTFETKQYEKYAHSLILSTLTSQPSDSSNSTSRENEEWDDENEQCATHTQSHRK